MMGALERVAKAPWSNSTPAEDAAYAQQAAMADNEFEQEVVAQMGPAGEQPGGVSAKRADLLPGGWRLRGTYIWPEYGAEGEEERSKYTEERYAPIFEGTGKKMSADTVYAVGGGEANKGLWGHEFLHRLRNRSPMGDKWDKEQYVRLIDGWRASSPDQWLDAVMNYRDYLPNSDGTTIEEAESVLKKNLKLFEQELIDQETQMRTEQRDRPKDRPAYFGLTSKPGSLRADQEEAFKSRKKNWDMAKTIRFKEHEKRKAEKANKPQE
jgi:hypothetical protein